MSKKIDFLKSLTGLSESDIKGKITEDELRLKAITRENKIDDILKDNNIGFF